MNERQTNVEFITELMDFPRSGPLMQAFVITALEKYAELVKRMPQDQRDKMDKGLVPYAPWEKCADEALAAVKGRYSNG